MTLGLLTARVGVMGVVVLATACGRQVADAPPEPRAGRDECAHCGMMISDTRCSAALMVERGAGRESLLFDDIGCLLDYRKDRAGAELEFVRGYREGRWIRASQARYLCVESDRLRTPMGSGIIALETDASAAAACAQFGGSVHDDAGMRSWAAARRGGGGAPACCGHGGTADSAARDGEGAP